MEMKRLVSKVEGLRKEHREIGERILSAPEMVVYLSATELAEKLGTSNASVVRFSQKLGFRGYPEMRKAFKQMLGVAKLPTQVHRESADSILPYELSMLEATVTPALHAQIDRAVSVIASCEAVIVSAYGIYTVFTDLLAKYYIGITDIQWFPRKNSYVETIAPILALADKKAALVVISCQPHFKDIIKAEEKARENGLKVIAVTDSPFSPAATRADVAVVVQIARPGIATTLAPVAAVIDEIGLRLSLRRRRQTARMLALKTERFMREDMFYE